MDKDNQEIIIQLPGMPKLKVDINPVKGGVGSYFVSMLKEESRDLTKEEQKRLFDYLHTEGFLGEQSDETPEISAVVNLKNRSGSDGSLESFLTS